MLIGYARVSTKEQTLDLQTDALARAGVLPEDVYTDKVSGRKAKRPGLELALKRLREGDTLVVWKLDRIGRSMTHLIKTVEDLQNFGVAVKSITEQIDINAGPMGKFIFHIICALAQFESDVTTERTGYGMDAARVRGRVGGRRYRLNVEQILALKRRLVETEDALEDIAADFNIKRRTINNYVPGGREALRQRIADGVEKLTLESQKALRLPRHAPDGITAERMDELHAQIRRELIAGGTPEQIAGFFNVKAALVTELFPGGRDALLQEIASGQAEAA